MFDLLGYLAGPLLVGLLCLVFIPIWHVEEASIHYEDPLKPYNNEKQDTAIHETSQEPQSINNNKNHNNMAFSTHIFMTLFH